MLIDLNAALPTFFITLREGVEAALVVGIVLAYLKKAGQSHLNPWVYGGILAGVGASGVVGAFFHWLVETLTEVNPVYAPVVKPALEGSFGVLAIGLLSWMLVWMTRQAKLLKAEVEGAISTTLQASSGAAWGIFGLIFFAVLREGFETVLFIAARFQDGWMPAIGAVTGLGGAVLIGVLLFQWGVKINIRRFFQVMGVLLLLIVAGLVVYTLHEFDRAIAAFAHLSQRTTSLCPFTDPFAAHPSCILGPQVWDASGVLPDRQFPGILLKTLFGYRDRLYLVQAIAYLTFLATVGTVYLQSLTGWASRTKPKETSPLQES